MPNLNLALDPSLKPPSDLEAKLLRQIVLSGMPDQVRKSDLIVDCYLFLKTLSFLLSNEIEKKI